MDNAADSRNTALNEVGEEPKPHLHAKTFLAVFAVFGIYFAQVYCLVGAGAVRVTLLPPPPLLPPVLGLQNA